MGHDPVLDRHVLDIIPDELDNTTILDVASGLGPWGFLVRTRFNGKPIIIAVDIWLPYIERVNTVQIYDEIVRADVRKLPFKEGSFEVVIACEVLEHMPKQEGISFLYELERVTRGLLIITTPLGFMFQDAINDNQFEKHVSAWQPDDFKKRGYSVKVVDSFPLPRTLRLVDKIRRWVFRLPQSLKEIIAFKHSPKSL